MSTYDLKFVADVTGVAAGLQKIPGMSEKAAAAAALKQATASRKAAEQTRDVWTKASKSIEANAKNIFGGVVGDAVDVVDAFGTIGPAGAIAGAGIAAAGLAAGALAASFVDVLMRADELAPKLEALTSKEIISKEAIADAKVAEQQIGNLSTVASGFAGVLVDKYAVAAESATSATVGLGAGAVGAYSDFADFMVFVDGKAISALYNLNMAINPVAIGLKALADNGREANAALQSYTGMTDEAYAASAKYHKEQDDAHLAKVKADREEAEAQKDLAAGAAERARRDREATAAMMEKKREAAAEQKRLAQEEVAEAKRVAAEKLAVYEAGQRAMATAHFAVQDAIEAADDAEMAAFLKRAEDYKKTSEQQRKDDVDGVLSATSGMIDAIGQVASAWQAAHMERFKQLQDELKEVQRTAKLAAKAGQYSEAIIAESHKAGIEKRLRNEKRMIIAAFVAKQSAAVSSIGMETAVAVMTALAQLGPVAGGVAAGLIIGTGAIQAGLVLAQKPPKFARGGEVTATLEQGEGIANKRAMAQPGFRQALDNANEGRGGGMSGGGDTNIYFNDRLIMTLMARGYRLGGLAVPTAWARAM